MMREAKHPRPAQRDEAANAARRKSGEPSPRSGRPALEGTKTYQRVAEGGR